MKHLSIIFLILFTSCISDYRTIRFDKDEYNKGEAKRFKYSLKIPTGYTEKIYISGEANMDNQYWYADSSIIYVSDFDNSLNRHNIRKEEYDSIRKGYIENHHYVDTLILEGKNQQGLWKEIMIGGFSYGYLNVKSSRKVFFDNSLNTLKKVR